MTNQNNFAAKVEAALTTTMLPLAKMTHQFNNLDVVTKVTLHEAENCFMALPQIGISMDSGYLVIRFEGFDHKVINVMPTGAFFEDETSDLIETIKTSPSCFDLVVDKWNEMCEDLSICNQWQTCVFQHLTEFTDQVDLVDDIARFEATTGNNCEAVIDNLIDRLVKAEMRIIEDREELANTKAELARVTDELEESENLLAKGVEIVERDEKFTKELFGMLQEARNEIARIKQQHESEEFDMSLARHQIQEYAYDKDASGLPRHLFTEFCEATDTDHLTTGSIISYIMTDTHVYKDHLNALMMKLQDFEDKKDLEFVKEYERKMSNDHSKHTKH